MKQTLEQERARNALDKVRDIEKKYGAHTDKAERFAAYVENLPAMILTNGLGQAAATLLARADGNNEDPHRVLYEALSRWICCNDPQAPYRGARDLMEAIVQNDRTAYLVAQVEALAWLEWMKKFAIAYLKDRQKGGASDVTPL